LAHYLGVDPVLVRIGFVALGFAGFGVLAYVIGWVVIPLEPFPGEAEQAPAIRRSRAGPTGRIVIGAVLITIGALMLLEWIFPSIDRFFWPGLLIAVGVAVFLHGSRRD
jgi:hypothetical protein